MREYLSQVKPRSRIGTAQSTQADFIVKQLLILLPGRAVCVMSADNDSFVKDGKSNP